MERHLIHLKFKDLSELATKNWSDPNLLHVILHEITFRKPRKKVRSRRSEIESQIAQLENERFDWPSTSVVSSERGLRGDHFWYSEGVLSFLGYRVGKNGEYKSVRLNILDYTYNEEVPRVCSEEYMINWGRPKSGQRLKKMAYSLASFHNNAVGRLEYADMKKACKDWLEDLDYLYKTYYIGRYDFDWPH